MVMALSSTVLISSQVSSWTKPTWLASMKQGSHIMLQRLVRSTVSTAPRPYFTVEEPWWCRCSSLWARMSRPGKTSSRCLREFGVDRHQVFEVAVLGAVLDHPDLAVALDDLGLDLADFFVHQNVNGQMAVENLLANFGHALRAERVGRARPAQRRLRLFPGLEQRLIGPLRGRRRIGSNAVQAFENWPMRQWRRRSRPSQHT